MALTQSIQNRISQNPNLIAVEVNEITLHDILREIQIMQKNLESLHNTTFEVNKKLESLLKDASGESKIEFANIKVKEGKWTIEAKCGEGSTGCFRNVDIVEVESNRPVTTFLLIEPYATIKRTLDIDLIPMSHLVAKIGNKIVSNPFYIPKVKILNVQLVDDGYIITIENLCSENIGKFRIIDGNLNEIATFDGIEPSTKSDLMFYYELGASVKLIIEENGVYISNEFQIEIAPVDFEAMVSGLSTEMRQQNARAIKHYYPDLNESHIIIAANYGGDNFDEAINYLRKQRLIS